MDWTARAPGIERAAEWGAAVMLGAAAAIALALLAPVGLIVAACGGAGAAAAAIAVQRSVAPGVGGNFPGFEPVDWPGDADGEVLLLDESLIADDGDALLLDDPLPRAEPSRVVRLFGNAPAGEPAVGDPAAIPAPGEMLARIETFLGTHRGPAPVTVLPAAAAGAARAAASAEASAALHAALADIRRSLRQA